MYSKRPSASTANPAPNRADSTQADTGPEHSIPPLAADNPPAAPVPVDRIALRLNEVAGAIGISRRALERERSAGRFPRPDRIIGHRTPVWLRATIERWIGGGR